MFVRHKLTQRLIKSVIPVALLITLVVVVRLAPWQGAQAVVVPDDPTWGRLFSEDYPVSEKFRNELKLMRYQKKITQKDEISIFESVAAASQQMEIPRVALLNFTNFSS